MFCLSVPGYCSNGAGYMESSVEKDQSIARYKLDVTEFIGSIPALRKHGYE